MSIRYYKIELLKKQSIRLKGAVQMKEIKIPELAESIMEGTIAEWLVEKGEKVEKGDPVIELETDKVNIEVHSEYTGVITEILSVEGDDVEVGDVIAKLDEHATPSEEPTEETAEETPTQEVKIDEQVVEEQTQSQADRPSSRDVL